MKTDYQIPLSELVPQMAATAERHPIAIPEQILDNVDFTTRKLNVWGIQLQLTYEYLDELQGFAYHLSIFRYMPDSEASKHEESIVQAFFGPNAMKRIKEDDILAYDANGIKHFFCEECYGRQRKKRKTKTD